MYGLENLLDEKDINPYLHRKMFDRHMSDIYVRQEVGYREAPTF